MDRAEFAKVQHASQSWESMLRSVTTMFRAIAEEDVWESLSLREYDVLYTLSKSDSPMRLTDLNRHVMLSQPALSRMADRLILKGYISRCKDKHDGRAMSLTLTPEGVKAQKATGAKHVQAIYKRMNQAFTDAEMDEVARLSNKLAAVIDAEHCEVRNQTDE